MTTQQFYDTFKPLIMLLVQLSITLASLAEPVAAVYIVGGCKPRTRPFARNWPRTMPRKFATSSEPTRPSFVRKWTSCTSSTQPCSRSMKS